MGIRGKEYIMAYYKKSRRTKRYNLNGSYSSRKRTRRTRKNSFSASLRDFARKLGQVQRGLQNPDSQISASYNYGLEKHSRKPKKTLF